LTPTEQSQCAMACKTCEDYFECRLPACPICYNRKWRSAHVRLEKLHGSMKKPS